MVSVCGKTTKISLHIFHRQTDFFVVVFVDLVGYQFWDFLLRFFVENPSISSMFGLFVYLVCRAKKRLIEFWKTKIENQEEEEEVKWSGEKKSLNDMTLLRFENDDDDDDPFHW